MLLGSPENLIVCCLVIDRFDEVYKIAISSKVVDNTSLFSLCHSSMYKASSKSDELSKDKSDKSEIVISGLLN